MTQLSWTGSGNGSWSSGSNWVNGAVPAATDDVSVTGPGTGTDLVVTGPGTAGSLAVLDDVGLVGTYGFGTVTVGSGSQGGVLDLTNGAAVGTGHLVLAAGGTGTVTVDGSSVLEVGTAGGAAVGTLTVDAGSEAGGAGTVSASGGIVDNGTLDALGGTLTLLGPVSGPGVVQIGAGATLVLGGAGAPSTAAVAFAGANGTLAVETTTYFDGTGIASAPTEQGVISGFAAGDTILFNGTTITAATYAAGGNGQGTLTLTSGTSTVGTLTLAGSYAGSTFQVAPNGSSGSSIVLAPASSGGGGGEAPSPGTTAPDAYSWTGGGDWNTAANWTDVTTGAAPAAVAPGANDLVTVTGPSGSYQTITGPGNAASLTLVGGTALGDVFNVGTLAVGTAAAAGALSLGSGGALTAGTATVADGTLEVAGTGTTLSVSGLLQLGANRTDPSNTAPNLLQVAAGAAVQAGGGLDLAAVAGVADAVVVDGTSSLELGAAGGAAAGTVTVDAGAVLSGTGTVSAAAGIANAGTILATGGTLSLTTGVSGSGTLQIAGGATLSLAGSGTPTAEAISFLGQNGTLALGSTTYVANGNVVPGLSAAGPVTGFVAGDVIHYGGTNATGVSYQAGSGGTGTLTLTGGGTVLGTLTLAGDFTGDTFQLAAAAGGGANITVAPTPPAAVTDPLFDAAYYLSQNPDVAAAGIDPYQHYLAYGAQEGRNPSALFSTSYYLAHNPDVAAAGLNPLQHYEQYGYNEGRNPDALFDSSYYLTQNPDVRAAGLNPLAHFQAYGSQEGRDPSLLFSDSKYLAANPDVAAAHFDPLAHYLQYGQAEGRTAFLTGGSASPDVLVDTAFYDAQLGATLIPGGAAGQAQANDSYTNGGWQAGRNPDALFNTAYYLSHNPDVAAAHLDPLTHYETYGWHEGRDPSAQFSTNAYLAHNGDVAAAELDPLVHYVQYGQTEGRAIYSV